jgi:hypothetical protein
MQSLMNVCGRDIRVEGRLPRIARLDGDKYEFLDDPEPVLDSLRKSGIRIDLFTFMQRLPEVSPKYAYPMEWDNLAVVPVSTFDAWWTQQVDNKTRNMVRKAEKKGVTLGEVPFDDALVQGMWEIYNECPVRQGRPFHHYGEDIETVRKEEATFPDRSIFIGAFLDGRLIGFVKLVTDETRTQAGMMQILSMIQHRDKAPTNALVAQAVRACADRGIRYLVYSSFAYGKKQRDSMSDFKENNGFQRIDLPRYYVPLTRTGSAAFCLGLHHRFTDRLPEPLVAKLRDFRNAWYNRKLQPALKAS